jgi:hypothetical protein
MKSWLRLTLVTVTVGGGFAGVAMTLRSLPTAHSQPPIYYAFALAALALFTFVTISGLIFVHDSERTGLLIISLFIQIPWVSSPIIAYKLATGFQVSVVFIGGRFAGGFHLGSDVQLNLFRQFPWGVGINLFALVLLILLLRSAQVPARPSSTLEAPPPVLRESSDHRVPDA